MTLFGRGKVESEATCEVKQMAQRPEVFDQEAFQESIRHVGCPESFVSPVTSDFRLFVPLALRELGPDGIVKLAEARRAEFGLGEQRSAWQLAAKYVAAWAEQELAAFRESRLASG